MPQKKDISKSLGIGRGAFRKAFLTVLMNDFFEEDALKKAISTLDNKCIYCGIPGKKARLQADLLWPQSRGGLYILGNVVPSCPSCNSTRQSMEWKNFLISKYIVPSHRSKKDAEKQISIISKYIKDNRVSSQIDLEKVLNKKQIKLRNDLDLILDAITQGLRAKIGHPQMKDVKFKQPGEMFDSIIDIAKAYRI